jgi:hypothetical protein
MYNQTDESFFALGWMEKGESERLRFETVKRLFGHGYGGEKMTVHNR